MKHPTVPDYLFEALTSAQDDCDGAVYAFEIIGQPQICFPFPAVLEMNITAIITAVNTEKSPRGEEPAGRVGQLVALRLDDVNHPKGEVVYGLYYDDFYEQVRGYTEGFIGGGRFCIQEPPSDF